MCGICGVYRFPGGPPIDADHIKSLLIGVQHRGADATGIALQQADGKVVVWKDDSIAHKAVELKSFEAFLRENLNENTQTFLGHTRAATQGNPRFMKNNHPMFAGKAAIVHNGCISNDDYLFKDLKLKREAETDSDIIRAIVDAEGFSKRVIRILGRITGSCASAAVHPDYPGKLLIMRSGSPCTFAKVDENLFWASEKGAIHLASRGWFNWQGIYFQDNKGLLAFSPMENDTALLIGQDGVEWHDKFDTCRYYTTPKYDIHGQFEAKKKRWDEALQEQKRKNPDKKPRNVDNEGNPLNWVDDKGKHFVLCPNFDCDNVMEITPSVKNTPFTELRCNKCDTPLKEEGK